jgi:hypothetical protein
VTAPGIVFKHHRETLNLGDRVCSPFDYYPDLAAGSLALDLSRPTPECRAVIYGGGKIMGGLAASLGAADRAARLRVAWGVSSVQTLPFAPHYRRAFRAMDLIGSRDWGDGRFEFAPCVTCQSPLLDRAGPPQHAVVLYLHHVRSGKDGVVRPAGIPVLDNTAGSLDEAIDFLASGETVVSNSYHGVYWALLLGRRVLCLPFSNKFYGYRVAPGYAAPKTWPRHLSRAHGSDEMLGLCRKATARFADSVRDRLAEVSR